MKLNKDKILDTAIVLLHKMGLNNLSMRALATELNIKAASLYWHFKDKQELLTEIAEYIIIQAEINDSSIHSENARCSLIEISSRLRQSLLAVRDSVDVLANTMPITPHRIESIKILIKYLLMYGVKESNCLTVANLVNNYILSFVADEIRFKSAPAEPEKISLWLQILGLECEMKNNFDEQFFYGLDVILNGLNIFCVSDKYTNVENAH